MDDAVRRITAEGVVAATGVGVAGALVLRSYSELEMSRHLRTGRGAGTTVADHPHIYPSDALGELITEFLAKARLTGAPDETILQRLRERLRA